MRLRAARRGQLALPAIVALWVGAFAATPGAAAQSRGELLYTTHCNACHTTQVHWRTNKAARDWASLKFQVQRWQAVGALGWSDGDVLDVTRYLNESIYRFDAPAEPVSSRWPGGGTQRPTSRDEAARGPRWPS